MLGFEEKGKPEYPGKKTSRNEGENQQQQTKPTGVDSAWFGDVMLLGSLSNDDGDGNENGKKGLD